MSTLRTNVVAAALGFLVTGLICGVAVIVPRRRALRDLDRRQSHLDAVAGDNSRQQAKRSEINISLDEADFLNRIQSPVFSAYQDLASDLETGNAIAATRAIGHLIHVCDDAKTSLQNRPFTGVMKATYDADIEFDDRLSSAATEILHDLSTELAVTRFHLKFEDAMETVNLKLKPLLDAALPRIENMRQWIADNSSRIDAQSQWIEQERNNIAYERERRRWP